MESHLAIELIHCTTALHEGEKKYPANWISFAVYPFDGGGYNLQDTQLLAAQHSCDWHYHPFPIYEVISQFGIILFGQAEMLLRQQGMSIC